MQHLDKCVIVPAHTNNSGKIEQRIRSIEQALAMNSLVVLVIEATSKCNLTCNFCGMHSKKLSKTSHPAGRTRTKRKTHIDLSLFNETIRKCQAMEKLKLLYLHGNGEPLLNPNIVKMVDIAKKADIAESIILVTNGVLLGKTMFEELVEAGITGVRISFDIISPEKYRQVKGADLCRRVQANIDACIDLIRARRLPVTLAILCDEPESEEFSEETKHIVSYYGPKIKDLPGVVIQYRKLFNWVDSINSLTDGSEYRRRVPCEQPFYLLMVHSDGDISMCCSDANKELVLGDIRKASSLKDILTSEALRIGRKSLLRQNYEMIPACEHCDVYSIVDPILLENREDLLGLLDNRG